MKRKEIRAAYGETIIVRNSWEAECEERGTTVTGSVWDSSCGNLSSAALNSNVATVSLAVSSSGSIWNTITLANGETLISGRDVWPL